MNDGPTEMRDMAPAGSSRALLRDTVRFCGRSLGWLILVAVAAAVAEGAGLLLLLPVLSLLGIAGSSELTDPLVRLLGPLASLEFALVIYVLVIAVASCTVAARGILVTRMRLALVDAMRARLHRAILAADWRTVARHRQSDLSQVLTVDINRTGEGVQFLLRLTGWAVEVPVLVAVALVLSAELTGLIFVFALLIVVAARPLDRLTHRAGRHMGPTGRRLMNAVMEDLASLAAIKGHGGEHIRSERFEQFAGELRQFNLAMDRAAGIGRVIALTGAAMAIALTIWFGVSVLDLALADTLVLIVALARLLPVVSRAQDGWRLILRALPAHATADQLWRELSAVAEHTESSAPAMMVGEVPNIELSAIGVDYASGAEPALRDLSLTIKAGEHVAVIGASGAGKSTLALVLSGLLAPDAGEMRVGGEALGRETRVAWRRRAALVAQDPVLFNESITDNLRLADPMADEEALSSALKAAGADFVATLPEGMGTVVGERGQRLSGGERQRIALARALLAKPALLILDEPTSAMDPAGEARVIETLRDLAARCTVVTVSHRPSLARAADTVILMENGRCVGRGAWSELDEGAREKIRQLGML